MTREVATGAGGLVRTRSSGSSTHPDRKRFKDGFRDQVADKPAFRVVFIGQVRHERMRRVGTPIVFRIGWIMNDRKFSIAARLQLRSLIICYGSGNEGDRESVMACGPILPIA